MYFDHKWDILIFLWVYTYMCVCAYMSINVILPIMNLIFSPSFSICFCLLFILFDMTFSNLVYYTLYLVFLLLINSQDQCIAFLKNPFLWLTFICKIEPFNPSRIYSGVAYQILCKLTISSFCINLKVFFFFFSFLLVRNKDFPKPSNDCRSNAVCLRAAAGHARLDRKGQSLAPASEGVLKHGPMLL